MTGNDRKGQARTGKDRQEQERTGKNRKGQERTEKDRKEQDRERTGCGPLDTPPHELHTGIIQNI